MEIEVYNVQKYFLFKLPDLLNNAYHIFEEKRVESIKLSITLCIDTFEEMNSSSIGTDKLEKSYKSLLCSLAFQLKKHPFYSLPQFKKDFEQVIKMIGATECEKNYELYMCLKTLRKKFKSQNMCVLYIECLQKKMKYGEIDILIEAFVSDLLYMGYALPYLAEWYTRQMRESGLYKEINEKNLEQCINSLLQLNGEKRQYEIIIPYQIKSENERKGAEQFLGKHFVLKTKEDFNRYGDEWKWTEDTYAVKKCEASDYYRAINIVKKEFDTDKELLSMCQNDTDVIHENYQVGYIVQDKVHRVDIRKVTNIRLISFYDEARTKQYNIFIELKDKMKNEDVDVLERVLHTLHTAKSYNIQNRFLNFWSALEYTIYPFPKNSIIEKARVLVSESFTLFYIKDKMNIFWKRLNYTMKKKNAEFEHAECKKFIDECSEDDGFNTLKFIEILQDESKYMDLLTDLSFHVVLEREARELIMLVTQPEKVREILVDYHDSIVHDLDCIYRLRNQLIHSAKGMDDSLEDISLRLYRYVNSIIATILYYKKRSPEVSIIEILNSLHNTYEMYMEHLKSIKKDVLIPSQMENAVEEGYKIVRPRYLFLE